MKFRLFLSFLPSAAIAFQQVGVDTSLHRCRATTTALQIVPERFERAQHCATHYGLCGVEEMEELADEKEKFSKKKTLKKSKAESDSDSDDEIAPSVASKLNDLS